MDKEQLLRDLLRTHDKYYSYSDDYSVYRRGEAQYQEISRVAKELGEVGKQLLDEYFSKG